MIILRGLLPSPMTLGEADFNPIIPCSNRELAEALIRAFNIDALYNVSGTPAVDNFIKELPHIPWPDFHTELFAERASKRVPALLDVGHPAQHLFESHVDRKDFSICSSGMDAGQCRLHLAQARSNRGPRGRKTDFRDAQRIVSRLLSEDLILSFVPEAGQRCWRMLTRTKYQLTRDGVRLQSQLESLLEECQVKLSSVVSDLLGASGRRILRAIAGGETSPARLAQLGDKRLCP